MPPIVNVLQAKHPESTIVRVVPVTIAKRTAPIRMVTTHRTVARVVATVLGIVDVRTEAVTTTTEPPVVPAMSCTLVRTNSWRKERGRVHRVPTVVWKIIRRAAVPRRIAMLVLPEVNNVRVVQHNRAIMLPRAITGRHCAVAVMAVT